MAEPDKIRNPRRVTVAGDDDVVADVILGEVVERPVAVGLVAEIAKSEY